MKGNKVIKSVSFNVTNDQDREMLNFIMSNNFSGYVKELIQADMKRRNQDIKIVKRTENGGVKIVISG